MVVIGLMKRSLLSLLLSLCSVLFNLTPCSGQMDLGGQQRYVHTDKVHTSGPDLQIEAWVGHFVCVGSWKQLYTALVRQPEGCA